MVPAIDQDVTDAAGAHFAEGDFLRVGGHGSPELQSRHCTSGHCASGQLSLTGFLDFDSRVPWLPIRTVGVHATDTAPFERNGAVPWGLMECPDQKEKTFICGSKPS